MYKLITTVDDDPEVSRHATFDEALDEAREFLGLAEMTLTDAELADLEAGRSIEKVDANGDVVAIRICKSTSVTH